MGLRSIVGVVALVLALAASVWRTSPAAQPAPAGGDSAAPVSTGLLYQGVASCRAEPCHGKNGPPQTPGTEYLTWLTRDPHAQAFQDLTNARSRQMTKLLGAKQPAHENPLCLGCHATPTKPARPGSPVSVHDGVGCESCHGPSEKWWDIHDDKHPEWKRLGQKKRELGFEPLVDLTVRAETCVRCHVGTGALDVNHDLIAAGHPRLNFEFGAYLANYPKHWKEKTDLSPRNDFEARAWLVGQMASARAALRLLADRADLERQPANPWPEFAEYDCFACHHDVEQPWRRAPQYARGQPGALPWNEWYVSLESILDNGRPSGAQVPTALLQRLREAMRKPYPDRKQVKDWATKAADGWGRDTNAWGRATFDPAGVERWLKMIDEQAPALNHASWDKTAQVYLALAALQQAQDDIDAKASTNERQQLLRSLRLHLGFPALFDSPRGFDPGKVRR